jgi:hypothetical protein
MNDKKSPPSPNDQRGVVKNPNNPQFDAAEENRRIQLEGHDPTRKPQPAPEAPPAKTGK